MSRRPVGAFARSFAWVCTIAFTGAISAALPSSLLHAQVVYWWQPSSPPARDAVPAILRTTAGTVALGLGNIGILSTDADAVFYNVAMLTQARGVSLSGQRYEARSSTASIASVQALGATSIGIGARVLNGRWSFPPLPPSAPNEPRDPPYTIFSGPTSAVAVTAAAARSLGPVRIGLGATFVREAFALDHDDEVVFDVGVVYPMGPMNAALTVQHIGESIDLLQRDGAPPWRAVLGFGGANYPLATFFDLSVVSQVSIDESGDVLPAVGGELAYVPIEGVFIAGRVGVRRPAFSDESAVTAGIGLTLDRYSLDYAFEPFIGRPDAHRLGLRIR